MRLWAAAYHARGLQPGPAARRQARAIEGGKEKGARERHVELSVPPFLFAPRSKNGARCSLSAGFPMQRRKVRAVLMTRGRFGCGFWDREGEGRGGGRKTRSSGCSPLPPEGFRREREQNHARAPTHSTPHTLDALPLLLSPSAFSCCLGQANSALALLRCPVGVRSRTCETRALCPPPAHPRPPARPPASPHP